MESEAAAIPAQDRLGHAIKRAEQAVVSQKDHALRGIDITLAQYVSLVPLLGSGGMSGAELARRCMVTPQTMATIITNLEAKGLVVRTVSRDHAKVLITNLTPKGVRLLRLADQRASDIERFLADEFTDEERLGLRDQLTRVVERLNGYREGA